MSNRILDVVVLDHRLDPVATELRVHVKVENLTPSTEIRGRLSGPRCRFASTIEIAYPLREVARADHIELRVVIPEPSWWDPQSPFLYEGALELLQDGVSCERVSLRHGIRRLQLTAKGLHLNGKPIQLRGKVVAPTLAEADAIHLRAPDVNTLLANIDDTGPAIWDIADRVGFFMLATANDGARFLEHRHDLVGHPSHFGWIFNRADFLAGPCDEVERAMFYGVNTSASSSPPNADFLVCHEKELSWLGDVKLPKIVITNRLPETLPERSDVIGWIESPTT
jgi:hypothetical protein